MFFDASVHCANFVCLLFVFISIVVRIGEINYLSIYLGLSYSPKNQLGKDLFDRHLFSNVLQLNNPNHSTLLQYIAPLETRYSPDISLVPTSIASKCTWQVLSDLGYNHFPISITISTPQ